MTSEPPEPEPEPDREIRDPIGPRNLRAGWWGVLVFGVLGVALELFHATKAPFYLDAGQETTRFLLRLAHMHGTLLSLVNVCYALTVRARPETASRVASAALLAAQVLLPAGFFVGGLWARSGDPGVGIVLVPVGVVALVVGAGLVVRRLS